MKGITTLPQGSSQPTHATIDLGLYQDLFTANFGEPTKAAYCQLQQNAQGRQFATIDLRYWVNVFPYFQKDVAERIACENEDAQASPATNTSPSWQSTAKAIIDTAHTFLGTKHVMGGMTKAGIDCSGLIYTAFKSAGMELPRVSRDQATKGQAIDRTQLRHGDLLFFGTGTPGRINHVGIVTQTDQEGGVKFIHTSTSKGVMVSPLTSSYWSRVFLEARRVLA
ncbi:MAG: NlpC/P60 family protein [Bacteroidota bacterium]